MRHLISVWVTERPDHPDGPSVSFVDSNGVTSELGIFACTSVLHEYRRRDMNEAIAAGVEAALQEQKKPIDDKESTIDESTKPKPRR